MILAHDLAGAGPDVVLLHAGVGDRRLWDRVVPALAASRRVLSPDLRGFGASPLPHEPYADADDVAAVMDHVGMTSAVVVGNSHGGRVALELATLHPERVAALVLLSPALRGFDAGDERLARFGAREDALLTGGDVAGAVTLNVDTWLGPAADAAARTTLTTLQRRAFDVQLAAEADAAARGVEPGSARRVEVRPEALDVPTTVVAGRHDLPHFRAVADHLVATIPGARSRRLAWAGHLPCLEDPAAAATLLDELVGDATFATHPRRTMTS
ncbi:alpha/beta fold hydrolase [Isoptericola jiangsuensis]|uniref:alpha/beta fold hydrolase n=1 Tax=Isoptericola jiangsuensis TaxID=548579 RepID=UPI000BF66E2D|nr:alpha/beta hydrolase [Isoptericola jiangsuensis]